MFKYICLFKIKYNNNIYYEPKKLKKRFTKPFSFNPNKKFNIYFYSAAKSIVRGRYKVKSIWAHFPHFLNNSNICRPDGKKVLYPLSKFNYSYAYIKHYSTKSTEEFLSFYALYHTIKNI